MVIVVKTFLSISTWGRPNSGISNESVFKRPSDFRYFNWIDEPNFSAIFADPILLEWTITSGIFIILFTGLDLTEREINYFTDNHIIRNNEEFTLKILFSNLKSNNELSNSIFLYLTKLQASRPSR